MIQSGILSKEPNIVPRMIQSGILSKEPSIVPRRAKVHFCKKERKDLMNILLARPHPHKDTINLASFAIVEPLELEYLAAYAQAEGIEADILDMIVDKRRDISKVLATNLKLY